MAVATYETDPMHGAQPTGTESEPDRMVAARQGTDPIPPALTVGRIALRLDEPVHRVEYVLRTRGIEPSGVAGIIRIYDDEAVERIADALRDIDARREGGASCTS